MDYKILQGDALTRLKKLPGECVNCVVTSPPYWGLRDYGTAKWEGGDEKCDHKGPPVRTQAGFNARYFGKKFKNDKQGEEREPMHGNCSRCGAIRIDDQIGLEPTPELYVNNLVNVSAEVKRVLKKDGTVWLNIGDSYFRGGRGGNPEESPYRKQATNRGSLVAPTKVPEGCKAKDLVGIPWMLAFALRTDGYYLRQDIIWSKPNPMPESVTDRCTKSHEYIFLLSKSNKYYFDNEAIKEPSVWYEKDKRSDKGNLRYEGKRTIDTSGKNGQQSFVTISSTRNKRSVWTVNTQPFKGAHFAVFPEKLITPCILAGCPENGTILDPFNGSGTTGVVSLRNMRNYIGIELNPEYIELSHRRIQDSVGLFAERTAYR